MYIYNVCMSGREAVRLMVEGVHSPAPTAPASSRGTCLPGAERPPPFAVQEASGGLVADNF